MPWLTPREHRARWRRRGVVALLLLTGFLAASLLDRPVYLALLTNDRARLEGRDWYQFLRAIGYLPTWLALALAMILHARGFGTASGEKATPFKGRGRRGVAVFLSAALGGLAAEILKLVFGRERPLLHDGWYGFKPLLGGFVDGSNLGLPSSHAGVAFGGAFMLAMISPRVAPVVIPLALGCSLTRMLTGAHFLSDTYAAGVVSYAIASALARALPPPSRPLPCRSSTATSPAST